MSDTSNQAFAGQRDVTSASSQFNMLEFIFRTLAGGLWTATPVQVIAVHPGTGLLQGTVDVQPLVNQQDALGNATPHGVIYGLPYARVQAGSSALIIDPVGKSDDYPGDIGVAVFASRDISSVKANKSQANPGSFRRFDAADGMYLFSALGLVQPTQYVQCLPNGAGINVISPGPVTIQAGTTATIYGKDVVVHGTESYSWDIYGYGQRYTLTGPSTYQLDTYTTGATVTSTEHGYSPPEIPPPS